MVPPENLPDLPFEIVISTILLMLPADELVRLMVVCKEWRDLIKDADFILKHRQFSASRGKNYLLCGPKVYRPGQFFRLLTDSSPVEILEREIQLDSRIDDCMLISSSNGLLLLTYRQRGFGSSLKLYNPFIQKCKSITSTSINIQEFGNRVREFVLGFGYHSQANDYKIVRIASLDVIKSKIAAEVYSLSTDSWRMLQVGSFQWGICASFSRALVNDCFHWMAFYRYRRDSRVILSFDLGSEEFQAIGLPCNEIDAAKGYKRCDVISYKDKLSFIASCANGGNGWCSLWVMSEYGVFDSWSWLFTVVFDERVRWPICSLSFTFTKNGELIYVDNEEYVLVYPFIQKTEYFELNAIKYVGFDDDNVHGSVQLPITDSLTLV